MRRPAAAVDPADAAIIIAVARQTRPTVRQVAADVVQVTHKRLRRLRAAGAVTWEPARRGTLRGLTPVAANPADYPRRP